MAKTSFRIRHTVPAFNEFTGSWEAPKIAVFPSNYSTLSGGSLRRMRLVPAPEGFQHAQISTDGRIYAERPGKRFDRWGVLYLSPIQAVATKAA